MIKKKDSLIKNYKVIEAFVQCNYLDGFKYIDKAGEIVNLLTRRSKEIPDFTMGLPGLKINNLTDEIKELRVSSNAIWIHFVEPNNLGDIENSSIEIINDIIKIIKPSMYSRIGWRTYFAREFDKNLTDPTLNLNIAKDVDDFNIKNIVMSSKVDKYDFRLEVSPIVKIDKPDDSALLFDVDLGKKDDSFGVNPIEEIKAIRQKLRSDEIFKKLEGLLK